MPHQSGYLSVVSVLELEIGILLVGRRDRKQGAILRSWMDGHVLTSFSGRILVVDTAVAQRGASLRVPNPHSDRDALIASTALVRGMTVVTRNVSDFQATGVAVIKPLAVTFRRGSDSHSSAVCFAGRTGADSRTHSGGGEEVLQKKNVRFSKQKLRKSLPPSSKRGRLRATGDPADPAELSFVCVGTVGQPNGNFDFRYIRRICEQIGQVLKTKASRHVVVIRSKILAGHEAEDSNPHLGRICRCPANSKSCYYRL